MNFPLNTKNPICLFYYKGTTYPLLIDAPNLQETMFNQAHEMIVRSLKDGLSLEQQKKHYKENLDLWEQTLCDEAKEELINEAVINRAIVKLGFSDRHYFMALWCLNICALLKLKVIKNDNNNGVLCIIPQNKKSYDSLFI
jgi:hypothetical protein